MTDFARNWRDYENLSTDPQDDSVDSDNIKDDEELWSPIASKDDNQVDGSQKEEDVELLFRSRKWKELEARPAIDKKLVWIVSAIFIIPIIWWLTASVISYFKNKPIEIPLVAQVNEPNKDYSLTDLYFPLQKKDKTVYQSSKYNGCVQGVGAVEMVNISTGEMIFTHNADSPKYLASISKLMTAYIVYNEYDLDELITFSEKRTYYQSEIGLQEGEFITVESALDALLILSGNDVGYMLADNYSGGMEAFVKEMNDTSKLLGLQSTKFIDPNGIEEKEAYSTAHEATLLLNFILHTEALKSRLETETVKIPVYNRSGDFIRYIEPNYNNNFLKNRNELLFTGDVTGGKTGTNIVARQNVVSYVETEEGTIVMSILGAESREEVGKCLLNGYGL